MDSRLPILFSGLHSTIIIYFETFIIPYLVSMCTFRLILVTFSVPPPHLKNFLILQYNEIFHEHPRVFFFYFQNQPLFQKALEKNTTQTVIYLRQVCLSCVSSKDIYIYTCAMRDRCMFPSFLYPSTHLRTFLSTISSY